MLDSRPPGRRRRARRFPRRLAGGRVDADASAFAQARIRKVLGVEQGRDVASAHASIRALTDVERTAAAEALAAVERAAAPEALPPSPSDHAGFVDRLRLGISRPAAVGLALLCAVGVVAGAAHLLRSRPSAVELPAAAPVRSLPASTGATAGVVVVDVAGAVRRPGVYRLPVGSRVADALRQAGGALPSADTAALNLARVLADGEQILVPRPGAAGAAGAAAGAGGGGATSGPLDLNTATREQLEALPGVGPVLAQRILDWRSEHGRFRSIEELREVSGVGERIFAGLRDKVRV